ncbi:glycerol-3-phosphate acyltransferase 1, mitochondrial isoform X3 [Coccinella septempunctata]|uniref:glycerol-3-phosphate acyltransferase 1, mitochondrial isoform X3 n=1 Tax=Coccinella septempunctata TaxID=41139 RepID=UPI001D0937E2|nr:glycerol-3-phosphate acyltransferase 1, mitochondrial isoform X3 [Coccinella septempunctata]
MWPFRYILQYKIVRDHVNCEILHVFQIIARMVDIVTSRMFESFNRFSPSKTGQTDSITSYGKTKRFSREQRCKKAISREADIKTRESQLLEIKEKTPNLHLTRPKSFLRLACRNCTFTSHESLVNKTTERMALQNMFIRHYPYDGIIGRYFSDIYYNWKAKEFDYILANDSLLDDESVKNSVELMTREQIEDTKKEGDEEFYEKLKKLNSERAKRLLYTMKSALSDYVLRCSNWFFHKMFPLFLNSVLVHPGQISMIQEASKSGLPLIFLPLHRSHLDYLLLTYILFNHGIKPPLVAAGDNLKLPFFGQVLKGLGAFYIKRRIDPIEGRKDHIYKAILQTYIKHSLKSGHNIEFFIEGGRTRTGKPLMPKYGIFSVIVDSLLDGTIEDALLVPVSMNYDKLVDGNFTREQLGEPKKMESVWSTIKSLWMSINGDFGMVKVDFNQPCSLREMIKAFKPDVENIPIEVRTHRSTCSVSSIYGTDVVANTNKSVIENISRHVVYDASQSTSVMATDAVAFLLLTRYRNGVSIEELATALDTLRQDLDFSQKELSFQGKSVDVINYAVDMLGPSLVQKEKVESQEIIKPRIELPNSIELSYYSNILVPHFALDSVIALAINSLDRSSGFIQADHLMEAATELCNILQYEFIFCKPCQTLDNTIQCYLDDLIYRKNLFIMEDESAMQSRSRRMARQFDDDDDDENIPYISPKYQLNNDPKVLEYLEFYRVIILPLLECYAVSAQTIISLTDETILETDLIKDILDNLQMQLLNNSVLYSESVSTDTVRNALKLFVTWGILECHNEGKLRLYYFRELEDKKEIAKDMHNLINKYRPKAM